MKNAAGTFASRALHHSGIEKGKARAKLGEEQRNAEVIEGKEFQGTTEK